MCMQQVNKELIAKVFRLQTEVSRLRSDVNKLGGPRDTVDLRHKVLRITHPLVLQSWKARLTDCLLIYAILPCLEAGGIYNSEITRRCKVHQGGTHDCTLRAQEQTDHKDSQRLRGEAFLINVMQSTLPWLVAGCSHMHHYAAVSHNSNACTFAVSRRPSKISRPP